MSTPWWDWERLDRVLSGVCGALLVVFLGVWFAAYLTGDIGWEVASVLTAVAALACLGGVHVAATEGTSVLWRLARRVVGGERR